VAYATSHLGLLDSLEVYARLHAWLKPVNQPEIPADSIG
jgi:hypothetical protein